MDDKYEKEKKRNEEAKFRSIFHYADTDTLFGVIIRRPARQPLPTNPIPSLKQVSIPKYEI